MSSELPGASHTAAGPAQTSTTTAHEETSGDSTPDGVEIGGTEVAREAQHHRLSSEQVLDLPAALLWLSEMIPYLLLMAALFLTQFSVELLQISWLTSSLCTVNRKLRKQTAAGHTAITPRIAARLTCFIVLSLAAVVWLTDVQWLARVWLLRAPATPPASLASVLSRVILADTFARLGGTVLKIGLLLAAGSARARSTGNTTAGTGTPRVSSAAHARAQGRQLCAVEHGLTLYRMLLPTRVWYAYLLRASASGLLSSLLVGAYLTIKALHVHERGRLLASAVRNAARQGAAYGKYISTASSVSSASDAVMAASSSGGGSGSIAVGVSAPASRRRNANVGGASDDGCGTALVPPGAASATGTGTAPLVGGGSAAASDGVGADVEGGLLNAAPDVGTCPVCHEALSNGVSLECSHLFCEDCICEWLERHRTCPMCRAEVKPAGLLDHTDGTSTLLPILF